MIEDDEGESATEGESEAQTSEFTSEYGSEYDSETGEEERRRVRKRKKRKKQATSNKVKLKKYKKFMAEIDIAANRPYDKVSACKMYNEQICAADSLAAILRVHCVRLQKISLNNDPLKQFCIDQCHILCCQLYDRLLKQMISSVFVKESMENVYCLLGRIPRSDATTAYHLAILLRQICISISEVANYLERAAAMKVKDWLAISQLQVDKAEKNTQDEPPKAEMSEYVPSVNDFENLVLIHQGYYGTVYTAMFKPSKSPVILKVVPISKFPSVDKDAAQIYTDKAVAAITSFASDPSLIKQYVIFPVQPAAYVVMMDGYFKRRDLLRVVEAVGYLSKEAVAVSTLQILLGIEHLHFNGIIHRDIKPSNVLVSGTGHCKVLDFDRAKICRGHFVTDRMLSSFFLHTRGEFCDGSIAGTITYTAPEVLERKTYGRSMDWWSLGIVVYKLATGKLPFRSNTPRTLIDLIRRGEYCWPKVDVEPHSANVTAKEFTYELLQKDPAKRLGSRCYSDVKDHDYILDIINCMEPVKQVTKRAEIVYYNPKHRIFGNACLLNMEPVFELIPPPKPPPGRKPLEFSALSDHDPEFLDSNRLLSYAYPKYRKLKDRLKAEGFFGKIAVEFMAAMTPPNKDFEYRQRDARETLLESSPIDMKLSKTTFQLRQPAVIPIYNIDGEKFIVFEFDIAVGDGNIRYPVVTCHDVLCEGDQAPVITGDILWSIAGTRVIGATKAQLEPWIATKVKEGGESLPCEVLSYGTFRLYSMNASSLYERMRLLKRTKLTLMRSDDGNPFITTKMLKIWNLSKEEFETAHCVNFVNPTLQIREARSVLYGDLVVEIDSETTSTMDEQVVNAKLVGPKRVSISILEMSVLHRVDLLERASMETPANMQEDLPSELSGAVQDNAARRISVSSVAAAVPSSISEEDIKPLATQAKELQAAQSAPVQSRRPSAQISTRVSQVKAGSPSASSSAVAMVSKRMSTSRHRPSVRQTTLRKKKCDIS